MEDDPIEAMAVPEDAPPAPESFGRKAMAGTSGGFYGELMGILADLSTHMRTMVLVYKNLHDWVILGKGKCWCAYSSTMEHHMGIQNTTSSG